MYSTMNCSVQLTLPVTRIYFGGRQLVFYYDYSKFVTLTLLEKYFLLF